MRASTDGRCEARGPGVWSVPALLAIVFAAGLTGVGALIVRSSGDPTFGIEPDYYAKALTWDQTRRVQARSESLGWECAVTADDTTLRVRLTDRRGEPLSGLNVCAEVFPWARSKDRRTLQLRTHRPGEYSASLLPESGGEPREGW